MDADVIVVGAGLAGLVAVAELADLERLSRDALSDVRRAVAGYRELTLPGEILRARAALTAAGIEARLPGASDDVPTELRELFAWTVREGVTNVLRHAPAATQLAVTLRYLGPGRLELAVRNDGPLAALPTTRASQGLRNMRQRAEALGWQLTAGPASGSGWVVQLRP